MNGSALDISLLTPLVLGIADEYRRSPVKDTPAPKNPFAEILIKAIAQILTIDHASDPDEWVRHGFRVVYGDPVKPLGGCFCEALQEKDAALLGKGAFGKVYGTHSYPCPHVPKDAGTVAVKVEQINFADSWNLRYQKPAFVRNAVDIAKKAGRLGLGPRLYDAFLCIQPNGVQSIVKIMEKIQGKQLDQVEWTSKKQELHAQKLLNEKVHALNEHGILHQDLHVGNIMVHLNKRGYVDHMIIVDYDRAKWTKDAESESVESLVVSSSAHPLPENDFDFLYYAVEKLIEGGHVDLNLPVKGRKTVKARRRIPRKNRTRT